MAIVGVVKSLRFDRIRGWAFDTGSRKPVIIKVMIGDVHVRSLRPVYSYPAFTDAVEDGRAGFKFRMYPELAAYVNPEQPLSFVVKDKALPLPNTKIYDRPGSLPLSDLRQKLENGWVVSKKGQLHKALDESPEWGGAVVAFYTRARDVFRSLFGYDLYIAYGTLLGHVRNNGVIPGDDDFDAAYLSKESDPAQVGAELASIVRQLKAAGEAADFSAKRVFIKWKDRRSGVSIDIFPSWTSGDDYYLTFGVGAPIAKEMSAGFEEVTFLGAPALMPIAAETLLRNTYGDNWRIPDPLFQWVEPRRLNLVLQQVRQAALQPAEY